MNIGAFLAAWGVDGRSVEPLVAGTNNLSYEVAADGERYILRVYQNVTNPDRIQFEHDLLRRLERTSLSFAVPAPIPTPSGATLVTLADGVSPAYAALCPLIPGQHPNAEELAHVRACGAALAELDLALASIDIFPSPGAQPPFGSLSHIHPAVADPVEMVRELPVEQPVRSALLEILSDLQNKIPFLCKSLPQQLVHRDFDISNVLIEGDRISGVLDFEFAGYDLRAIDLARSLTPSMATPWSVERRERAAVFVSSYRERLSLTSAEIDTLPDLMLLYRIVSLIHREGRRRQGLAGEEDVAARATALVRLQEWLRKHREDLERLFS